MKDEKNYSEFFRSYLSLCKKHGYTVYGAAKTAGISTGAPAAWKDKGSVPRKEQREKLCALFGVSDEVLLGYKNENPHTTNWGDGISEQKRKLIEQILAVSDAQAEFISKLFDSEAIKMLK